MEKRIDFEAMPWKQEAVGVQEKHIENGPYKMRLLQFDETFVEHNWCLKGHVGYVLEGEMQVDFDGQIISYKKGDGLWIEPGLSSKHKVKVENGSTVKLMVFEPINPSM